MFPEQVVGTQESKSEPPARNKKQQKRAGGLRAYLTDMVKGGKPKELGNSVDLPEDRCFVGLDAYREADQLWRGQLRHPGDPAGVPPAAHLEAAVKAGKNLFTEKPVAVDATGIRKVLAAGRGVEEEGPGDRRRHPAAAPERLHRDDQADPGRGIGDVVVDCGAPGTASGIWFHDRASRA